MRKVLIVGMLVLFAAGLAWSGGDTEPEPAAAEEKLTITWFGMNPRGTLLQKDSMVELYLEEKFNVNIEPWYDVDGYANEQWQVKIAAGDIPDVARNLQGMLELGVSRELSKDMIAKHMPITLKKCLELAPDTLWFQSEFEGKNYGIPFAISIAKASPLLYIRKDWMANVGSTAKPDTLDELETLFTKFRNEDPDQDGEKDTYAYITWHNNTDFLAEDAFFPSILGAFGVTTNTKGFTQLGNKVGRDTVTTPYKDAMKYLAGWYEKELIHPEFVTARRKEANEILANGKAGVYEGWSAWAERPGIGPFDSMQADNPDVRLEFVISPAGPGGKRGVYSRDAAWGAVFLGKDVSDQKAIKIMEMLEVMHTDEDTYSMINLGKKGEHWDFNDSGDVIFIGDSRDKERQAELGITYFIYHFIFPPNDKYYVPAWRLPAQNYAIENQTALPILFGPSLDEEYKNINSDILRHEMEFAYRAISGAVDIDAEWDTYVNEWKRKGGDRLVEEASRIYNQ